MPGAGTKQQQAPEPTTPIAAAGDLQMTPGAVLSEFEQMCVAMSVSGALIAVRDLAGLRCTVSFGSAPPVGSRLPTDSDFTNQCIRTGEAARCEDVGSDPRIHPAVAAHWGFRSAAAVPMRAQGSVVGLIGVFWSQPSAPSPTATAGLQRVAKSFVALMIFDAANGRQPVVGGSLEQPIVLPRLIARHEPTSATDPGGKVVEPPEKRETDRTAAAISQLPSDKPTPTRVWLIAAALLLGLSLLFLFLFRGGHRSANESMENPSPEVSDRATATIE